MNNGCPASADTAALMTLRSGLTTKTSDIIMDLLWIAVYAAGIGS
jgi:hypothetical protein